MTTDTTIFTSDNASKTAASPTETVADNGAKIHTIYDEDLHEQARAFMAEHGVIYTGDFPETEGGKPEVKNFEDENGKAVRGRWIHSHYREDTYGNPELQITFQVFGKTERIPQTFKMNDPSWKRLSDVEKEALRKKRFEQRKLSREQAEKERGFADELADKSLDRFGNALNLPLRNTETYFIKKGLPNPQDNTVIKWEKYVEYSDEEPKEYWVAIVALRDGKGNVRALQELWPEKRILYGGDKPRNKHYIGKTGGCYATFGKLENGKKIYVFEGVATAFTGFISTNVTAIAAMDSGNISKVIKELNKRYPKSEITICADNDHHRQVKGKGNPGVDAAMKAAKEFNCKIAIPEFPKEHLFDDDGKQRTDFDDLRQLHDKYSNATGKNVVREQIEKATYPEGEVESPIIVAPSKIHEAVDAAEQLICEKNIGIYQRGGQLVRIVEAGKKSSIKKRDPKTLIINEADSTYLEELLTKEGRWCRYDVRTGKYNPIDCPNKVPRMLKARMGWSIHELRGVIRSPTIREDGSVLQLYGYDPLSGLYFHDDGVRFPPISNNPTKDEAIQCREIIKKIYEGFPFENEASRSVAIASVLTGLIRKSISTAPMHGFTAPKMGSGKSLLAEIVSLIVTGRKLTAIPQAESEPEERKRLLAVLLEGDPIVCYDNIEDPFKSSALCSVLTQHEFKDRILGQSKSATAPTDTTFLITGNNLVFVGDISTRVVLCKINPETEKPEERSFDMNLKKYIPRNRGLIVHAFLTILKAYDNAGRPSQNLLQYGRFEEWSDWIRSALVWLDMADPCESRMFVEEEDPARNELISVMQSWFDIYDDMGVTVQAVIKKANAVGDDSKTEALKDSLISIAAKKGQPGVICPLKLASYLSKHQKRIESGLMIEKSEGEKTGNKSLWKVRRKVS